MESKQQGFYAVDIAQLSLADVSWKHIKSGIDLDSLPKVFVPLSTEYLKDAAILSWRWDRIQFDGRSRNVALALRYAVETGIKFLFLDYISLDQSLEKSELLKEVFRFGEIYAQIPVISTYDEEGKTAREFQNTLLRPWILRELRKACTNPTSIVHVGYQTESITNRQLSFENEIFNINKLGFAHVIYDLLEGTVGMTSVEDLSLILQEFEPVFSSAFSLFSRSDYLLTAFLLTAYFQPTQQVDDGGTQKDNGVRLNYGETCFEKEGFFDRYTLGPSGDTGRGYEWQRDILLDGKTVAILRTKMTSSFNRNWVEVLPEAESHILDVLQLSGETRTRYENRDAEKRASLYVYQSELKPMVDEKLTSIKKNKWIRVPSSMGMSLGFMPRKR